MIDLMHFRQPGWNSPAKGSGGERREILKALAMKTIIVGYSRDHMVLQMRYILCDIKEGGVIESLVCIKTG